MKMLMSVICATLTGGYIKCWSLFFSFKHQLINLFITTAIVELDFCLKHISLYCVFCIVFCPFVF